jgi:Uma2 family endonuclease
MIVHANISAKRFERLAPELGPCELVRGEVVPMSPGGFEHSQISGSVAGLLGGWARKTRSGRILTNEAGLITERGPDTVRGADVAYYSYRRLPRGREPTGFVDVPPELVVEIVGKGQGWRAMMEKAAEYLRMGVDRVWVIDPRKRSLHVFRPDAPPEKLDTKRRLKDADILPKFSCRVSEFFE